jgi:predicted enzyme related to lactoylglutathione lyase
VTPPELRLTTVTVTSPRPLELARFYAELLGWSVTAEEEDWAEVRSPTGAAPKLDFERTDTPVGPDQAVTVNLQVDDLDAAVEWAVSRGATLVGVVEEQDDLRVLHDPDGHPFGIFR